MADVKKNLLMLGSMGVILLILIVTMAVALLVGSNFKEQICEQDGGTYASGACSVESEAYNATVDLIGEITTVVGFVGLVVLTAIGAILIGMARSFMKDGDY